MAAFEQFVLFLQASTACWLLYICALGVYRLFFHPLAKFPGPKHAAISRWHEYYHEVVRKGQFTFVIEDYHRKYGPIVRVTPDELHIQDSEFYDMLYTKFNRADKYDWMGNRFGNEKSAFGTASASTHAVRRKALNPFFSRSRIVEFEEVIRDKVQILTDRIDDYRKKAQPLNIKNGFMALVGDVIMQYCFSLNYDHLNSANFETSFHKPIVAFSITGHLSLQFPIVPKILLLMPETWLEKIEPSFATIFGMQRDLRLQIEALKQGKNINAEKSTSPSVFRDLLRDPELPEREKDTHRLQDEAQAVVAAGFITTGWSLCVGTFYIINEPKIYQRLHQELVEAMPNSNTLLSWPKLERLPYLTGCVKEAIRLSYPVTARNPRLLSIPLVYKDWVIPARTPVSMTINDISNDENIFPNHEKFNPERWINAPKTKGGESLDHYFVCFQKGARSCVGQNLAYAEMYLTFASIFRRFRFELYETDESDVKLAHDFFIASPKLDSQGIRVKCVERF